MSLLHRSACRWQIIVNLPQMARKETFFPPPQNTSVKYQINEPNKRGMHGPEVAYLLHFQQPWPGFDSQPFLDCFS